jgi:hypothetical protein
VITAHWWGTGVVFPCLAHVSETGCPDSYRTKRLRCHLGAAEDCSVKNRPCDLVGPKEGLVGHEEGRFRLPIGCGNRMGCDRARRMIEACHIHGKATVPDGSAET